MANQRDPEGLAFAVVVRDTTINRTEDVTIVTTSIGPFHPFNRRLTMRISQDRLDMLCIKMWILGMTSGLLIAYFINMVVTSS